MNENGTFSLQRGFIVLAACVAFACGASVSVQGDGIPDRDTPGQEQQYPIDPGPGGGKLSFSANGASGSEPTGKFSDDFFNAELTWSMEIPYGDDEDNCTELRYTLALGNDRERDVKWKIESNRLKVYLRSDSGGWAQVNVSPSPANCCYHPGHSASTCDDDPHDGIDPVKCEGSGVPAGLQGDIAFPVYAGGESSPTNVLLTCDQQGTILTDEPPNIVPSSIDPSE